MNEVGTRRNIWNFHPELPIENAPVFVWPPRPLAALRYLLGRGFVMSPNLLYVGFAVRNLIGVLYTQERAIRKKKLTGPAKLAHRREHSLAAVEAFFAWCKEQRQRPDLLPRNPLASALHYAVHRETGLRVFLDAPKCRSVHRHQPLGAQLASHSHRAAQLAVRVDRARRPTRRRHPESACHLPAPRRGPLRLPRRCPATRRRAPGKARHRAYSACVEDDVRGPPLAF